MMATPRFVPALVGSAVLVGASTVGLAADDTCPVTVASDGGPAAEAPPFPGRFWFGSESLAVLLDSGGKWWGMGPEHAYRDKLFWRRQGYDGALEPRPDLFLEARRLDGAAPPATVSRATNARHEDLGGWAMLVVVELPVSGCWEITGRYRGAELSFVVDAQPSRSPRNPST